MAAGPLPRDGTRLDTPTLDFMIHHVFLLPRLPQNDDTDGRHLLAMVQTLRDSVSDFMTAERRSSPSVNHVLEMLNGLLRLRTSPEPGVDEASRAHHLMLRSIISDLKDGDVALLHLRDQNAGLLITSRQDSLVFETFELLAPNRNVMSCKGCLLRNFPDRAVTVPTSKIRDTALLDVLVGAMRELMFKVAPSARPKVTKAETVQPEQRDTLSSMMATGLLTDILAGLGREVPPSRITKRSREQVCFENAFLPFHRSAMWLLLRVALRLVLDRLAISNGETSWYKPLMAYHHARILDLAGQATQPPIPSDKLFSMQAKLARRIMKLNPTGDGCSGWLQAIRRTVVRSQGTLKGRWANTLDKDNRILPLDGLSNLSFLQDSELKLGGFRKHLSWIESRHAGPPSKKGEGDTTRFPCRPRMRLPSLSSDTPEDEVVGRCDLVDLEAWVESSLSNWVSSNESPAESAVSDLRGLIESYYTRASPAYDGIPGALSVMYMVIAELWVAMDKIAGGEIPLLLDYDPGFPPDLFNSLLLETKEEMSRLNSLEDYLSSRRARAPNPYRSAFRGFGCGESFAVRYYRNSVEHQDLRHEIEAWAAVERTKKLEEYGRMKAEYNSLTEAHNSASCEYSWSYVQQEEIHSSSCERCRLERRMEALRIEVFEWPLPKDSSHADAAVFEINVPRVAALWRDVTWRLVAEVFCEEGDRRHSNGGQSLYFAANHGGMRRFLRAKSRLQPASIVKPMGVAHYRIKHISDATPQNVCVLHAAQYRYYDEPSRISIEDEALNSCVPRRCSYAELVKGNPVEDWVRYTKHSSNDVIAGQYRCPLDVALSEFRSFGNLRSGVGLQWANVLCQLVTPSLAFNEERTLALVLQACLEAGPQPDSGSSERVSPLWREAHIDTQKESFMHRILLALRETLVRVGESWQNNVAVCILTCLATRLLYLSPSGHISSEILDCLEQLRDASLRGARLLRDKVNESDNTMDRERWISKLLVAALTCATTFNVGEGHLEVVLSSPDNLSRLIESSMLARNHLPPSGKPTCKSAIALQLMQRWHTVMYRARHLVAGEVINQGNLGMDRAIRQFWADHSPSPSAGWTRLGPDSQSHILTRESGPVSLTFNLLTGNFFLDGNPLSKLPSSYQKHTTFRELFGEQILDVGPSSVPGMEFSACRDQNGWVLHFAMKDSRLVVHAVRRNETQCRSDVGVRDESQPDTWEYIPREHLSSDLPNSFVNDYAHWLHLSTGQVEFRPIDRRWDSDTKNWRLAREDHKYILRKGSRAVLDPSSPTAVMGHRILSGIETAANINVILDCNDNSLALELPRFSLSFHARQGESTVQSKNYTGMQIDKSQGVGSLVGLDDKLVLKPEHGPGFRMVLVPRGQVRSNASASHVKVSIHHGGKKRAQHDAFLVDDKLGCLVDAGSLQSRLYLCLLHACTSHCLPDSLTSRTGTDEALRLLQGAAVRSYPALDNDSRELLGRIAELSPRRLYYPANLEDMEQTEWSDAIPPLSQHDAFRPLAKSIFDDYKKSGELFQPGSWAGADTTSTTKEVFSEAEGSSKLAERARIRNAVFRVSEFGAEGHTTDEDAWYYPRDRTIGGSQNDSKLWVSRLVKCMDTGPERLLFKPSSGMSNIIQAINGTKFKGCRKVTMGFRLENTCELTKTLGGLWCGLHRALVAEENKYKKMFFLSSLLYAEGSNPEVVQVLMALSNVAVFSQPDMLPPPDPDFDLGINRTTLRLELDRIARGGKRDRGECPEYKWTRNRYETVRSFESRRDREWRSNSDDMVKKFVSEIDAQVTRSWAVRTPTNADYHSYLRVHSIMPQVLDSVETARRSEAFLNYLTLLSKELGNIRIMENYEPELASTRSCSHSRPPSSIGFVSAASLFLQPAPCSVRPRPDIFETITTEARRPEPDHARLPALLDELSGVGSLQSHQVSYINELRRSINSQAAPQHVITAVAQDVPSTNLQDAREKYDSIQRSLQLALTGTSIAHRVCIDAGVYPRISPVFLLQRLTRRVWTQLSHQWRRCLVDFALSLVYLQRAERLDCYSSGLPERLGDLQRELSNLGDHENADWDPLEYPENLLLEIEQGIMIRPVQNKIAAVMRSPPRMRNSVMQLNMGEGKSSVIVPIVASALANGEQLVRVVVAKPHSNQMMHMLISKLGGLMNRRVFYLPFSRSVELSRDGVTTAREIMETCRAEGGVLLVQPEHLLSFKLMGIDKSWAATDSEKRNGGGTLGEDITSLYQHFESVSRDIVDESDENFSVKFELIYTMGAQEAVEMSPDRWILIQHLLEMTETVARRLMAAENDHTGMGVAEGLLLEDHGAGRVPVIRILEESAGRHLVAELAAAVCCHGIRAFPVHNHTERIRRAVLNYISVDQATAEDIALVEDADADAGIFSSPTAKNALLLLRGLLAKGVILFALGQKRFRVNYGLAPSRRPQTMLAVPYRAKDMPSPRSEFSHPDVVIVLTCLSYYYGGLSDDQLYTCLKLLSDSDQAEQQYGIWASKSPDLPPSFKHFSSLNLEDEPQCESIVFPALRYTRPVVDFFLSRVVFPKEMKQFPLKLSSSGWDLAKPKKHPLTGFSGTNDSKGVLPLSVAALDLQPHTNAAVLDTVLGSENTVQEVRTERGSPIFALPEEMLLGVLARPEPPIQVVLDVGAQIIESSNLQMAKKLLHSAYASSSSDAVIFFDDQDELSVLLRNGDVVPFLTSPFATRTDRCLVFLDQAHTRGTDLKLPDHYRAAVTLGPGVTKDTLVQACMRMRKLGRGQSVSFIVSPEMQKRIRAVRSVACGRPLNVADVVAWAISETWDEAVRNVLLWATQGIRHIRQEAIWEKAEAQGVFSSSHAREYLEPEAMCLEERYRPKPRLPTPGGAEIATLMANLDLEEDQTADPDQTAEHGDTRAQVSAIRDKLVAFAHATGTSTTASSTLQEEQERELAPEMEEEHHVARPLPRTALLHKLDPRLVRFVGTGDAEVNSTAPAFARQAFSVMSTTSAATLFRPGLSAFPCDLFATEDFARTVDETGPSYRSDSYQRGPQWVLVNNSRPNETTSHGSTRMGMVLVSQWEASRLKGVIEKLQEELESKAAAAIATKVAVPVTLHAYLPRPSLSFPSMEHLKTYTVPPVAADWEAPRDLVMQLNLFAGQLYLRSYDEYKRLCRYLGLAYAKNDDQETAVPPDGFVGRRRYPECRFASSPVAFLAKMYGEIRGDCAGGAEKTHMGRILAGEVLTERDFC